MCGIAGIISFKNYKVDPNKLKVLSKSIKNRGPDNQSTWINNSKNVALSVARLATKDKRNIANQPCFSSSKNSVCIMNGEIYNYNELKKKFIKSGTFFKSNNDTELLVNGLEKYGADFLKKIDGQFAFIFFNIRNNLIYAGRDRFGICPLYYSVDKSNIIFCSNPNGIYDFEKFKKKINYQALVDFHISDSFSNGFTIFKNINYLKNNQYIEIKGNKIKINNIDENFSFNPKKIKVSQNKAKNNILKILKNSVKNKFYGDKKVGVYLSAGIDSFGILSILNKIYPNKKIHTFTANFQHVYKNNLIVGEGKFAKKFSKKFNSIHHEVTVTEDDLLKFIKNSKLPCPTLIDATIDKLSKECKKYGVEVVLSGEGADEMFFGYDHFLAVIGKLKKNYSFLNKKYKLRGNYALKKIKYKNLFEIFLGGGANIDENNKYKNIFTKKIIKRTINYQQSLKKHYSNYYNFGKMRVENILPFIDYNLKVPENLLRRGEGPSMDQGVEMRFPFLCNEMISYVYSLPLDLKIGYSETKILLRKSLKKILPKEIVDYPKTPFGVPTSRVSHYKGSRKLFEEPAFKFLLHKNKNRINKIIFNGKINKLNIFNKEYLVKILNKQKLKQESTFDHTLWKIWSLSEWLEKKF